MEFRVIIPARYDSKRLVGKVLMDIGGKPMIQHVYERSKESGAEQVIIATDDKRIAEVAEKFGATVCMTAATHQSGTERLSEAAIAMEYDENDIVVCVQGDVPLISPEAIRLVAEDLYEHDNIKVTSLACLIENAEELFDPNVVKVVMNRRNYAMYFSRAPIPWDDALTGDKKSIQLSGNHFRHVGLYAYRVGFLTDYMNWTASPLESLESLEQLRILWQGGRIHLKVWKKKVPPSVDTQQDLDFIRENLKTLSSSS